MGKQNAKIDKVRYKELIDSVDILSINLKSLAVDNYEKSHSQKLVAHLKYSHKEYTIEGDQLRVYPSFVLNVKEEDDDIPIFSINIKFIAIYYIKDISKYTDDYLNMFMDLSVTINVWPYGRELISSLTTRMGYPPLVIEPFKA